MHPAESGPASAASKNRGGLLERSLRFAITRPRTLGWIVFALLMGISLTAAFVMPNSYRSEATLFVKLGRESVALDPTVTALPTVALNETREVEINSILEVLRSRSIAERVVSEIGADAILSGVLPGSAATKPSPLSRLIGSMIDSLRRFNDGRDVAIAERATRRLMKDLVVTVPKKTTVLSIYYDAKTPEMAQQVLNRVLEILQAEHSRINRVEGTFEFLSSQRELLEQKLNEAQYTMLNEKNRLRILTIEGARKTMQDEIALLTQQLTQANVEMIAATARMRSLEQSLVDLPDRQQSANTTGLPNEATDRMRETLYQLQIRERDLLARYTESHPEVVQVRKLVEEAEAVYEKQGKEREQIVTSVHPSKQQIELQYITEKTNVASLSSRIATLESEVQNVKEAMARLNQDEIRLAELQRQIDLAENSLKNYSDRLEQSRLDRELMREHISNLNVVQPPSYQQKPVSPPRLLLLFGGFFFAIVGGIGSSCLPDLMRFLNLPESADANGT